MNFINVFVRRPQLRLAALAIAACACCLPLLGLAAPGAHGPGGEHLATPAGAGATASVPRIEAYSDAFELVATLVGGELSILIDRYATNEPVLGATLEVEFDNYRAKAKFHADHGDYAIDAPEFLKVLSAPGAHELVFTILVGKEGDLLNGTLTVPDAKAAASGHDHHHHEFLGLSERTWIAIGIGAALLVLGAALWRNRRNRNQPWGARA
jgi:hypothetical protein